MRSGGPPDETREASELPAWAVSVAVPNVASTVLDSVVSQLHFLEARVDTEEGVPVVRLVVRSPTSAQATQYGTERVRAILDARRAR